MKPVLEKRLLQAARRLDQSALADIYDRWSQGLYRYALRLLGDPCLAEECVAETFRRFLEALQSGRGPKDFLQAYLYRIAHNWITDTYRCNPALLLPLNADLAADQKEEPAQRTDLVLEQQQLRSALMALTPDQRQVIILKYIEDWDNKAIARAVNKPVGAVKSLQHRALERLRQILTSPESKSI